MPLPPAVLRIVNNLQGKARAVIVDMLIGAYTDLSDQIGIEMHRLARETESLCGECKCMERVAMVDRYKGLQDAQGIVESALMGIRRYDEYHKGRR